MNQILQMKTSKFNKTVFRISIFQFLISSILLLIILFYIFSSYVSLQENEKISNLILSNYTISKVYSQYTNTSFIKGDEIFCIIQIPSIDLEYPVFNFLSDKNLKLAPARLSGTSLENDYNICIAGHNYDNGLLFSNIPKLNIGDIIYLTDINNIQHSYIVYLNYEVSPNNLEPLSANSEEPELTLITCNNYNNMRIIIKAKKT